MLLWRLGGLCLCSGGGAGGGLCWVVWRVFGAGEDGCGRDVACVCCGVFCPLRGVFLGGGFWRWGSWVCAFLWGVGSDLLCFEPSRFWVFRNLKKWVGVSHPFWKSGWFQSCS